MLWRRQQENEIASLPLRVGADYAVIADDLEFSCWAGQVKVRI
jgi:hypothetical protein